MRKRSADPLAASAEICVVRLRARADAPAWQATALQGQLPGRKTEADTFERAGYSHPPTSAPSPLARSATRADGGVTRTPLGTHRSTPETMAPTRRQADLVWRMMALCETSAPMKQPRQLMATTSTARGNGCGYADFTVRRGASCRRLSRGTAND